MSSSELGEPINEFSNLKIFEILSYPEPNFHPNPTVYIREKADTSSGGAMNLIFDHSGPFLTPGDT